MSRNADEGSALYEQLFQQGVNLIFLKEPHINTDVYKQAIERRIELASSTGNNATDRLLNSIMDALNRYSIDLAKEQVRLAFGQAQKEVDDLHQRTKEGIETARRHNKQIGQRPGGKLNVKKAVSAKECIRKNSKAFGGSLNDGDGIKLAGISRNTFYKRTLCRYFHFTSWRFVFELSIFDRINSICKLICVAHKFQNFSTFKAVNQSHQMVTFFR